MRFGSDVALHGFDFSRRPILGKQESGWVARVCAGSGEHRRSLGGRGGQFGVFFERSQGSVEQGHTAGNLHPQAVAQPVELATVFFELLAHHPGPAADFLGLFLGHRQALPGEAQVVFFFDAGGTEVFGLPHHRGVEGRAGPTDLLVAPQHFQPPEGGGVGLKPVQELLGLPFELIESIGGLFFKLDEGDAEPGDGRNRFHVGEFRHGSHLGQGAGEGGEAAVCRLCGAATVHRCCRYSSIRSALRSRKGMYWLLASMNRAMP